MSIPTKFATQFASKFKQNLQQEIKSNKNLVENIENFNKLKSNILNFISRSKTIKMADQLFITPLRISDSVLLYSLGKTSNFLDFLVNNRIQSIYSKIPQKIKDIDNFIEIPKYYGGNKYTKIDKAQKKYNQDERSISFIENELIPNIFFNKNFKLSDEKSQNLVNLLHEHVKCKFKLKDYSFYTIECVDYRNVETDGYNEKEHIGFNFDLQVICKYFDKQFTTKNINLACFIKFDGNDRIIQFDFNEM